MSNQNIIDVEVENDFINRALTGKAIQALIELVWNAFDADAENVYLKINHNELGIESLTISDDGTGIDRSNFKDYFKSLGVSWKKTELRSKSGRYLHGKLGQGRFKSFIVGRDVEWKTTVSTTDNKYETYTISGLADNPKQFRYTESDFSDKGKTGTVATIKEIQCNETDLTTSRIKEAFSTVFANYLSKYPKLNLYVEDELLDPSSLISYQDKFDLEPIEYNGERYDYTLNIIEWDFHCKNEIHFCNMSGLPILPCNEKPIGTRGFNYTAYLRSEHISTLSDKGLLDFDRLEPSLNAAIESCINQLNVYFQKRKLEKSVSKIDRWKKEEIYPYKNKNYSPIEQAEKDMFDILAVNISDSIPSFERSDNTIKKFQLQLLKQIVNTQPSDLQNILNEVLKLSKKKQRELSELIKDVSLNSIINMSKVVSERISFITGLEAILYNKQTKASLKERTQLHKILAENTWVFGDAFNMTVNDQSLTKVLEKHLESKNNDLIIDKPVKRVDGRTGIVDLMLTRSLPTNHNDQVEHLVVELKAPKVKVGHEELTQIKSYAFAVADDERFENLDARWTFIVISNELSKYVQQELKNDKTGNGIAYDADNIRVVVKTWSQIITECQHRLKFMKDELNLNVSTTDGLKYIKEHYAEYTEGVEVHEYDSVSS
ncbi:DNA mismatch repair protein [Vibrio aestuarianus]|uniref:ATP-binding protein n=1 Tax=Vibrio aestuarianus TaxID=28171 RepID=UPI001455E43B|nr:ATP-binding protein [Vibrio aestuarianus]NLS56591.1 DNA mismatch repair protein [Vibrio aestuarianus subsp. francensis]CAH8232394.1 DNA mismatch repair protein [Vibrio aestuarianus]